MSRGAGRWGRGGGNSGGVCCGGGGGVGGGGGGVGGVGWFFFFNDTATTEIYTLSLHDALPISSAAALARPLPSPCDRAPRVKTRCRYRRGRFA